MSSSFKGKLLLPSFSEEEHSRDAERDQCDSTAQAGIAVSLSCMLL